VSHQYSQLDLAKKKGCRGGDKEAAMHTCGLDDVSFLEKTTGHEEKKKQGGGKRRPVSYVMQRSGDIERKRSLNTALLSTRTLDKVQSPKRSVLI